MKLRPQMKHNRIQRNKTQSQKLRSQRSLMTKLNLEQVQLKTKVNLIMKTNKTQNNQRSLISVKLQKLLRKIDKNKKQNKLVKMKKRKLAMLQPKRLTTMIKQWVKKIQRRIQSNTSKMPRMNHRKINYTSLVVDLALLMIRPTKIMIRHLMKSVLMSEQLITRSRELMKYKRWKRKTRFFARMRKRNNNNCQNSNKSEQKKKEPRKTQKDFNKKR